MPNLAKLETHTDAVVAALRAAGLLVIDGGPPVNPPPPGVEKTWGWADIPGQSDFRRYVIVQSLPGGVFDGPLGCPDDDASLMWQVTCVAETRSACQWVADKANAALIGQTLAVQGRSVPRLSADMADGGVRPDDTVQPRQFIASPRYRAMSTPA